MKRIVLWAAALLVPMMFYTSGLAYGRPRPEYSPSTVQNAWLNGATVFHPDAFAYVGIPYRMLLKHEWNPHYYHNPSLNIYTNLAVFWLSGALHMPHNSTYGDREIAPFPLYVMAEYLSALYSLLTVVLTYAAGRIAFHRRAGLFAAGIVAFSPLTVQHAHYATPNAQTTLLATAALLLAFIILKNRIHARLPAWTVYALGGLLVGLTMAARYNAAVVGLVVGLAMLTDGWLHRRWLPVVIGFAMMPAGFALGTPGILLATSEVVSQIRDIMEYYRQRGGGPGFTAETWWSAFYYHWRYAALFGVGPLATALAAFGLGAITRRGMRSRQRWQDVWIGVVLPLYLLVYTILALPGSRLGANLLFPLFAPLALLAGHGLTGLWQRWGHRRSVGAGLAIALLSWPVFISVLFVYRISAPDNRMEAQEWIYQRIPRGTQVYLLGPYNVPLDPLDYQIKQTYAHEAGPQAVQRSNAQVIVYSDAYPFLVLHVPSLSDPTSIANEAGIRQVLETEWTELARFKRWYWPGEGIRPDDVSYWHQIEIVVYCNPADCPVEDPPYRASP